MKKLLILSGKGGTGKTTAAAAFIRFADARAFADCDVDAPNLHLVSNRRDTPETSDFHGTQKARIDPARCIGCGQCAQACRFGAVRQANGTYAVDEYACEGCGVCAYVCPAGAAALHDDIAGKVALYRGDSVFVTAELTMGRGNSGKLVSEVKSTLFAAAPRAELAVIDGSPGIGCPVIASMSGADLVLIVTEPSVSGLSDMERILQTASVFRTKAAVCVNKYDQSPEHADRIERYCAEKNVPFTGRIPYDSQASAAVNAGKSLADVDCPASRALRQVYRNTIKLLDEVSP
jgi:MinD superfamily P-loop ATPase